MICSGSLLWLLLAILTSVKRLFSLQRHSLTHSPSKSQTSFVHFNSYLAVSPEDKSMVAADSRVLVEAQINLVI